MDGQELRNLQEAYYNEVYNLSEAEIMKHQQERDRIEGNKARESARVKKARSAYGKLSQYSPPTKGKHGEIERRQAQKPPSRLRSGSLPEEYDLYDIILSHLLDEGYAETPEAAESIMVNMSEEWIDSIVGEVISEGEKPFPYEKVNRKQASLRPNLGKDSKSFDRTVKMGMAKRRAKEAEKTGGSQQDAGKGWYHGR